MPDLPSPIVLAMLICDAIHRDPGTGKSTLLGTFSTIGATQFPAIHPFMGVFVVLTGGRGKVPLELRLVTVDEDHTILSARVEVEFPDPRAAVELAMNVQNAQYDEPGEYRVQLYCGHELLSERRIMVFEVEKPHGNENAAR